VDIYFVIKIAQSSQRVVVDLGHLELRWFCSEFTNFLGRLMYWVNSALFGSAMGAVVSVAAIYSVHTPAANMESGLRLL